MNNIVIGGDICPQGKIESAFKLGNVNRILNDVSVMIDKSDYFLANLECPLISEQSPIDKDGPVLGADIGCVKGLKSMGLRAVNLANNHILDHGEKGLISTINACKSENIAVFGAGKNIEDAQKPYIKTINSKRFCFMGIAEHEFSIAQDNSWGANPADPIRIIRALRAERDNFDHLIVLVHGGKEYYRNPTPKQQDLCRFLVEEGADAVICQHSHCAGTYEYYREKPIVYGQGNFIFESLGRNVKMWNEGFLVSLNFKGENVTADFIPFIQSPNFVGVKLITGKEREKFLLDLDKRSQKIISSKYVKEEWVKLCKKDKYLYASRVLGHNRILRVLNRKFHFSDWLYSKTTKKMVRNVVECETHREGLETLWNHDKLKF